MWSGWTHGVEELRISQVFWILGHYGHVTGFSTVLDCPQECPVLFVTETRYVLLVHSSTERANKLLKKSSILVVQFYILKQRRIAGFNS